MEINENMEHPQQRDYEPHGESENTQANYTETSSNDDHPDEEDTESETEEISGDLAGNASGNEDADEQ